MAELVHRYCGTGRGGVVYVLLSPGPYPILAGAGEALPYTLTEQPGGEVVFAMHEAFTGLLAPLITRSIPNLQPVFDEFAAALKQRAEGKT